MLIVLMAIVIGAIMARSPITGGLARQTKLRSTSTQPNADFRFQKTCVR